MIDWDKIKKQQNDKTEELKDLIGEEEAEGLLDDLQNMSSLMEEKSKVIREILKLTYSASNDAGKILLEGYLLTTLITTTDDIDISIGILRHLEEKLLDIDRISNK